MSSIIHPIHTVGQKLRPKHQVLVLKCYPKYQKNVQEVRPNSSELSYLLYYASTRRSKLQKVGAYLEKKTASDIWRRKLGNVQVTLQILTALIEKAPRDLPLYSRYVLTILDAVLGSKDINMIEESVPTFETFCKYINPSSLSADQERAKHYQSILQAYSKFASQDELASWKVTQSFSMLIRWRTAGLRAIRAIVGSEALGADTGRQLNTVIPVILENLRLEDGDILASLQKRAQTGEKTDFENARKRRLSIATVATVDTFDADPAAASGTTADADKVAEDEVRVLAVRCLKQIFAAGTGSQRGQILLATTLTLRFIAVRNPTQTSLSGFGQTPTRNGNWATSLIEAVARWTPVQDRFIIVVTAMQTLVGSPIVESLLEKQLALATMIDWLLSSSINLIGLSVMDVLLGFIQHTLLLLQLGGRDSKIAPHQQQTDALDLYRDAHETFNEGSPFIETDRGRKRAGTESTPSPVRQELLVRLQKCIGDLATHIYYTDQVSDMLTAILARLKPSAQSDIASATAAIDDPSAAARSIARSVSMQEDPNTDGFFSFANARITALRAIKDILITANLRKTATGASAEARSRVGIQVWEGTQWLLRDNDREVRLAYVDALLTWLKLETNKTDLHLPKDGPRRSKSVKKTTKENGEERLATRAVSNASRRDLKLSRSTFLQLLHLAAYDNALEASESDSDMMLLHLLLTMLIERLGVNAIRSGLPMILKLQEIALNEGVVESPKGRVNIACLVHGYLWALTEKFDFETTKVGTEIHAEVSRRSRHSLWLKSIKIPPVPIEGFPVPSVYDEKQDDISMEAVNAIKPFLNGQDLVEAVALAYDDSLVTPPTSPSLSPGRVFSVPTLGFGYGYSVNPGNRPSKADQLPEKVKLEMLAGWSREGCIAAVEKESTKTVSISGSRAGTSSGLRQQHLGINGLTVNDTPSGRESPANGKHDINDTSLPAYGLFGGLSSLQKLRRAGSADGSPVPLTTTSSRESTVRVTDLRRALSDYQSGMRHASPLRRPMSTREESIRSDDSDSMVSFSEHGESALDLSAVNAASATDGNPSSKKEQNGAVRSRSSSSKRSNKQAHTVHDQKTVQRSMSDPRMDEDVPPVPRIPSALNLPGTFPKDFSPPSPTTGRSEVQATPNTGLSPKSQKATSSSIREGRSMKRGNPRPASRRGPVGTNATDWSSTTGGKVDLGKLLAGIGPKGGDGDASEMREVGDLVDVGGDGGGVKPPY